MSCVQNLNEHERHDLNLNNIDIGNFQFCYIWITRTITQHCDKYVKRDVSISEPIFKDLATMMCHAYNIAI